MGKFHFRIAHNSDIDMSRSSLGTKPSMIRCLCRGSTLVWSAPSAWIALALHKVYWSLFSDKQMPVKLQDKIPEWLHAIFPFLSAQQEVVTILLQSCVSGSLSTVRCISVAAQVHDVFHVTRSFVSLLSFLLQLSSLSPNDLKDRYEAFKSRVSLDSTASGKPLLIKQTSRCSPDLQS